MNPTRKIHYFAYGSNLARKQMEEKAPGHKVYGLAYLEDYRLIFNGGQTPPATANLLPARGEKTYGLLYEVRPSDLMSLDSVSTIYQRMEKKIFIIGIQRHHSAWVYCANQTQEALPSLSYVYKIYSAARIIPGYQPSHLEQLEKLLLSLKP